jgi:hypothetical protein
MTSTPYPTLASPINSASSSSNARLSARLPASSLANQPLQARKITMVDAPAHSLNSEPPLRCWNIDRSVARDANRVCCVSQHGVVVPPFNASNEGSPSGEHGEKIFHGGDDGHELGKQTSVAKQVAVLQQQHLQLQQTLLQHITITSIVASAN